MPQPPVGPAGTCGGAPCPTTAESVTAPSAPRSPRPWPPLADGYGMPRAWARTRSSSSRLVERETDAQVARARAVCRRCRVLLACRSWAVEQGEDAGIWGATTARQRRAISRETRGGIGRRSAS
ncbi:WhiB family transcriptional regulator [Streptomyces sp. NPDC003007]